MNNLQESETDFNHFLTRLKDYGIDLKVDFKVLLPKLKDYGIDLETWFAPMIAKINKLEKRNQELREQIKSS